MVWECQACSYIYDGKNSGELKASEFSSENDKSAGIPADWICPVCGVGPEFLEEISGRSS